jgi:hypothetical protein
VYPDDRFPPKDIFLLISKEMGVIVIVSLVLVCLIIVCILNMAIKMVKKEGFYADPLQGDYEALRVRLKTTLRSYCDLTTFVRAQMKELYMTPKLPDSAQVTDKTMPGTISGETELEAEAHVDRTYSQVYECTDDGASSRPLCAGVSLAKSQNPNSLKNGKPKTFTSCDNYMNLPDWPDQIAAAIMLEKIPDDLPARIAMEMEWYGVIVKQLSDALAMGANPPSAPPDSKNSPATNSNGKSWTVEGFAGAKCSASAEQTLLERARRAALDAKGSGSKAPAKPDPADDPETCQMPSLPDQIKRVNALLESPSIAAALSKANSLKEAMVKLQSDQQKLKDGTLYAWQKDGPRKSYEIFGGGDRIAALLYSMKQVR